LISAVAAGMALASHFHRSEHWVVVKGTAEVTVGNDVRIVPEYKLMCIPIGAIRGAHQTNHAGCEHAMMAALVSPQRFARSMQQSCHFMTVMTGNLLIINFQIPEAS
jgi:quercetin dioxygenase-like cupin family protein